jgi:hypothetical protein
MLHHPKGLAGARNLGFGGPGAVRRLKTVKQGLLAGNPYCPGRKKFAELV